MITPEDQTPPVGETPNQQSDRPMGVAPDDGYMTLEELGRSFPLRGILGLFRPYMGNMGNVNGLSALGLDKFNVKAQAADPLAAQKPQSPPWKSGPLPDKADEATRKAYAVSNQQFQAGETVAKELAQTALVARAQDVPTLLNRLLATYSDLGSVTIQLVGAAVAQAKAAPPPAEPPAAPSAAAQGSHAIAVELTASCSASVRALLYGPLGAAPVAGKMTRIGSDDFLPAPEMKVGPVVHITVPEGAAPGEYHSIIFAEKDGRPAGTASVTVAAPK